MGEEKGEASGTQGPGTKLITAPASNQEGRRKPENLPAAPWTLRLKYAVVSDTQNEYRFRETTRIKKTGGRGEKRGHGGDQGSKQRPGEVSAGEANGQHAQPGPQEELGGVLGATISGSGVPGLLVFSGRQSFFLWLCDSDTRQKFRLLGPRAGLRSWR